jgi:hypothetical protein
MSPQEGVAAAGALLGLSAGALLVVQRTFVRLSNRFTASQC